jgi:cytochrome c oxidase assembly protein subunit 15
MPLRLSPGAYRVVTLAALAALAIIVVTGATVRLTGSGLGCSDWPECEEGQFFAELDEPHAIAEFANRLFTGVVSASVILAVLGSLARRPRRRDLTWLSLGLVAGVLAQIVWGGFTVWSKLDPRFVMGHYLISSLLIWNAVVLSVRAGAGGRPRGRLVPHRVHDASRAACALTALVLVTGTIVTNTGPHAGDEDARRFGFEIGEVARLHAGTVLLLLITVVAVLWAAYRAGVPEDVRRRGGWVVGAVVVQGAIGYVQYFTGVPVLLVGLHVLGSVLVLIAVVRFHLGLSERPPLESTEPAPREATDVGPHAVVASTAEAR